MQSPLETWLAQGMLLFSVGIAAAYLLLLLTVFLAIRHLFRTKLKKRSHLISARMSRLIENALLPLLALGLIYPVIALLPLSERSAAIGQRVSLVVFIAFTLVLATRLLLLFLTQLGGRYRAVSAILNPGLIWLVASVLLLNILITGGFLRLSQDLVAFLHPLTRATLILAITWLLAQVTSLAATYLEGVYVDPLRERPEEAIRVRSLETHIRIVGYVVKILVVVVGVGVALSQFTLFQTLATSLLASAGIASIVIGLAAQRTLGNLFGGIQIAFTQPVRIGDSVLFEGEWGWIEEITMTYVVIRIWDLRRLVVPVNYLLERPLQNWTKTSPQLIGSVFIYTDYRIDVPAMREALGRILESTDLWNRKVPPVLQVTDCKEETIELRALCSADTAPQAWELRCHVREELLAYLQELEGGRFLPRTRLELERREGPRDGTHADKMADGTRKGEPTAGPGRMPDRHQEREN